MTGGDDLRHEGLVRPKRACDRNAEDSSGDLAGECGVQLALRLGAADGTPEVAAIRTTNGQQAVMFGAIEQSVQETYKHNAQRATLTNT